MCLEERNRRWDGMGSWGGEGGRNEMERREGGRFRFIYLFIYLSVTGHEGDWDYDIYK